MYDADSDEYESDYDDEDMEFFFSQFFQNMGFRFYFQGQNTRFGTRERM